MPLVWPNGRINLNNSQLKMSITKTRQKLVEVARELFARQGLEATTMNDLAAKAGGRSTPISGTKKTSIPLS